MKRIQFDNMTYSKLFALRYRYIEILEPNGEEIEISDNYFKIVIHLIPHKEMPVTNNTVLEITDIHVKGMIAGIDTVYFNIQMPF